MTLKDYLSSIDARLARIEIDLAEHMRRTLLLETHLVPLQDHVKLWGALGKILTIAGALLGIATGVKAIWP